MWLCDLSSEGKGECHALPWGHRHWGLELELHISRTLTHPRGTLVSLTPCLCPSLATLPNDLQQCPVTLDSPSHRGVSWNPQKRRSKFFSLGRKMKSHQGPCSQCTEDGAVDQHTVHTGRPGPQQGAVRQTVVPATHEAEAGRVLKPRRLGAAWGTQKDPETPFQEETNKKPTTWLQDSEG